MWTRRQIAALLAVFAVTVSTAAVVLIATAPAASGLLAFRSYEDLTAYLSGARGVYGSTPSNAMLAPVFSSPTRGAPNAGGATGGTPGYSSTNVQVAGVDELDMVKTDGTYLYVASTNEVVVFLAYPAKDLHVVHRIVLANLSLAPALDSSTQVTGLFLTGDRLVVVANQPALYGPMPADSFTGPNGLAAPLLVQPNRVAVLLFDVSRPADPILDHSVVITGYASTGRLVGGTAYLVATQWIMEVNGTYAHPGLCADGTCRDLSPDQIYRDPQSVDAWDYTNLLAVNVTSGASSAMSVVTGGSSLLYMSPTAMYLAFYKWQMAVQGPVTTLMPVRIASSWTTIYKLRAEGLDIAAVGSADVPGSLLNQYSMDEWRGYLRVATTVRDFGGNVSTVRNDVYVFDGAMELVGSVKGLAPGESIFATRFLEDKAYVVTFRQIDPLFVIDLTDPTSPRVSGFLEMPGFSDYLYPLDGNHLLGVGKDAIPAADGNWSWYQGLKLSLYDVANASSPSELSNVTIGDRGTDSEVLRDPHAFLYVPGAQLVVLPVDLAIINGSSYPYGVPSWAWGEVVWQGAYVYRVNETTGFQYVGRIAHGNGTVNATYGWYDSPFQIRRSLYIGEVLYTVSETEVLASSLADLSEVGSVVYATPSSVCPYCYTPGPIVVA